MSTKAVQAAIEASRTAVARAVEASMRAVSVAMADKTDDEIKLAFEQNTKEAPMWAHAASRIAATVIKAEQGNVTTVNSSLSITLIGKAENNAAWLDMATPFAGHQPHNKALEAVIAATPRKPSDDK